MSSRRCVLVSMVPIATYRLQMHAGFTFDDAAEVAGYLRELGVSHVYFSPYLQAAPGSTHGYDVIDHNRVNEELGGKDGHQDICDALERAGLGQVLDIVPNHMAIGPRNNVWWWDVLENGPSSRYAHFFDVEWDPPEKRLQNLVLVPVLGDHYGRVLESGELRVERERGSFQVRYYDHALPVAPRSLPAILGKAARICCSDELAFLSDGYEVLPLPTATDEVSVARRHRDKEILNRHLQELCDGEPVVASAIDQVIASLNRDYDALDQFLSMQNYRLAYWRMAGRDLGYRRFFDINTLVGLRIEDERVFRETHKLVLDWLHRGVIDGVRIDHPDGLRNPEEYLDRLRGAASNAWIVAEKILEPGEQLRNWKIDGTSGYDFLFRCSNIFVDSRGEEALTRIYSEFTGRDTDYVRVMRKRKDQVLRATLASDVNRLTADFMQMTERHRRYRDFTRHEIHHVLREIVTCFPVYRTYVRPEIGEIHDDDRRYINQATDEAKKRRPDLAGDLFDFVRSVLLLEATGPAELEFVARFQQFTGPAMAKGVEDTTFYVFNRLSSLNEVGGDPSHFGITVDEFHRLNSEAQKHWPAGMLTTSTHDTKRSEDVRLRIHVLSEIPEEWGAAVARWSAANERYRSGDMPDRNIEYLLYQTLVGAWPIDAERTVRYMEKASREAKTYTSWTDPNPTYDEALRRFVTSVFEDEEFLKSIGEFAARLTPAARVQSLAQTLIKLTAPGVPDIYQGTEIWDLSLVDPDNRRPVDYPRRKQLLSELGSMNVEEICNRFEEGLPKLWLIQKSLQFRRAHRSLFDRDSTYSPLYASGAKADHVVAFVRSEAALTVTPRLVLSLKGDWGDTRVEVPQGKWTNVLTGDTVDGGEVSLRDLLRRFPVALLGRA